MCLDLAAAEHLKIPRGSVLTKIIKIDNLFTCQFYLILKYALWTTFPLNFKYLLSVWSQLGPDTLETYPRHMQQQDCQGSWRSTAHATSPQLQWQRANSYWGFYAQMLWRKKETLPLSQDACMQSGSESHTVKHASTLCKLLPQLNPVAVYAHKLQYCWVLTLERKYH